MTRNLSAFLLFLAAVVLVAMFGSQFMPDEWYRGLEKPAWHPPDWVFGPVWTVLYVLIAISGWLAWRARGIRGARVPMSIYGVQLVLNAIWPALFFGLQQPGLAFAAILLLLAAIVANCILFWRIQVTAGLLLLPYLAWVTFAAALNGAIWHLN